MVQCGPGAAHGSIICSHGDRQLIEQTHGQQKPPLCPWQCRGGEEGTLPQGPLWTGRTLSKLSLHLANLLTRYVPCKGPSMATGIFCLELSMSGFSFITYFWILPTSLRGAQPALSDEGGQSGTTPLAALVNSVSHGQVFPLWPFHIKSSLYLKSMECLLCPAPFPSLGWVGRLDGEWLAAAVFICLWLLGRVYCSLRVSSIWVSRLSWAPARLGGSEWTWIKSG